MSSPGKGKHIAIIGAGVIGLQTAVSLLEAGYAVTVLAKHMPGDLSIEYTSPWAGADWRTMATDAEPEIQAWDLESYKKWFEMLEQEKGEPDPKKKSGVAGFWTYKHPEIASGIDKIWYAPHMRSFSAIPASSLPLEAIAGITYDCISIDTAQYLRHLASRVQSHNGILVRAELPTTSGLPGALVAASRLINAYGIAQPIDAFVNATGIQARDLVPDPAVYPIRGQTVAVRGTADRISTVVRADAVSYVIPRGVSGTTILGGTRQADDWNPDPDDATTKRILEQCKGLAPELLNAKGEFDVLSVNVGRRPGRKGGPRVEVEEVGTEEGMRVVVHEYGHAGAGYQNSIGSAGKAVRLLDQWFGGRPASAKL